MEMDKKVVNLKPEWVAGFTGIRSKLYDHCKINKSDHFNDLYETWKNLPKAN